MNDQPTPRPPDLASDWRAPVGAPDPAPGPAEKPVAAGGRPSAAAASSEPGAAGSWLPAELFGPPPPADAKAGPSPAASGAAGAAAAEGATAGAPYSSPPVPRFAPPGPGRRSSQRRLPFLAAGLAVAAIAAAAIVISRSGGGGAARPSGTPAAQAPAGGVGTVGAPSQTVTSPPAGPGLQVPFVVNGSRFAVFAGVTQPWTRHPTGIHPSAGEHFEFITVLARRLVAPAADLGALDYHVVDGGRIARPVPGIGTGRRALGAPRARAINRLVVNHLAFAVTGPRASLRLEFAPRNGRGPTVAVPLAG